MLDKIYIISLVIVILLVVACQPAIPDEILSEYNDLPEIISFDQHVKPILSDKCFACHGPDQNKLESELRLDIEDNAKSSLSTDASKRAISEGNLNRSEVYHRIISDEAELLMPPAESNLTLSPREKAILTRWIQDGAEYTPHWAFEAIQKPVIPTSGLDASVTNEIDYFILDKLQEAELTFNTPSKKSLLLRRLSFDLTGLPPSLEELDGFIDDSSQEAYEKQVDRLLASKHYGERMANDWMDVARFADTHGYQSDRYRDMSPWRDWVIKSFNENLSYADFVTWQLAGDLLDDPTQDQRLATGFLRLHQQNEEGGIVEEEFKVEYVTDRINTVGTAFMGLTVGCAKCHDHKYDPISQKEYFEMYSFFNNVKEAGQISFDGGMPVPTMLLTDSKTDSIISFINEEIEEIENQNKNENQKLISEANSWMLNHGYKPLSTQTFPKDIRAHFKLNKELTNAINSREVGEMKRAASADESPTFVEAKDKNGLLLDGDAWLDITPVGTYHRYNPFNVSLWITIPKNLTDGVIFHKGTGAALYNFKGVHLALKDNKLELMMAHLAPYNAIIEYAKTPIPRAQWIHLSLNYDGSSTAAGLSVYVNGIEQETDIDIDNLYKDIVRLEQGKPVGLQFGARWRGKGVGGAMIDDITVYDRSLTDIEILQLADNDKWISMASKDADKLTAVEKNLWQAYYISQHQETRQHNEAILQKHKERTDLVESLQEVMVMDEMPIARQSYILDRGQYDSPTEKVYPNTPIAVLPFKESYKPNRLGFAQWLLDEDHPLTARVAVNRYWQLIFGEGLVITTEDFGNQGRLPKNKELLDWLALDLIENGWDINRLIKQIVMSTTYRQSSVPTETAIAADPNNDLYSRGPSGRLSAEMIRDNVLTASQLLIDSIGGPSVYPYQPDGLWGMLAGKTYPQPTEADQYRRSLYTIWKRTMPHPTQATFDAPERSECMVRRQETNTPLQALALMNDQIYLEASKKMATDILSGGSLQHVFTALTGRPPTHSENDMLTNMYTKELTKHKEHPEKISSWLSQETTTLDNRAELASYAVVISTIMNTDACIVKR